MDDKYDTMKLTRLPMGAQYAPAKAQYLTSALMRPLMRMERVKVFTMIDNVRIAARNRETFLEAVRCFLRRCQAAGVRLNDLDWSMAGSCAGTLTTPIAAMSERQ